MSFFSHSSHGNHYKNGHHGSNHYQSKGLLGDLFNMMVSGSISHDNHNVYGNQYDTPIYDQPIGNQTPLICGKCKSNIPAGSKFCLQCGEKVNTDLFCMNCGAKMPPNAKFCSSCGTQIK